MRRRFSPAVLRYFLARFRPLAQVRFWAPALGLVGMGVFAWQISQNPDWLEALGRDPAQESDVPKEDLAIGADIDSLPLLLGDVGSGANANTVKGDEGSVLLPSLAKLPGNTPNLNQDAPIPSSGSLSLAGLLLDKPTPGSANSLSANALTGQTAGSMFGNTGLDATPRTGTSALADAMARYSAPTSPASAVSNSGSGPSNNASPIGYPGSYPAQGTAPVGQTTYAPVKPTAGVTGLDPSGNSSLPNSYTGLTNSSDPGSAAGSAVAAPVRLNPGTGLPADAGIAQPFAPVAPTPTNVAPPEPFSTSRIVPGRVLGNGRINTFSNP
jgi:hypothetical protein